MNSITIFLILVPIIGFVLLLANILLAKHAPYSEKVTAYAVSYTHLTLPTKRIV